MIIDERHFPARMSLLTRILIRLSGGIPEDVARHPGDRAHYIGLAWTMLTTSSLAVVGMTVLLTQITTMSIGPRLLIALGWGFFVLGIDYLVVGYVDTPNIVARATTPRGERVPRINPFATFFRTATRIVFAVVIGLVVGESLVIGVFGSAANDHLDARLADATRVELCLAEYDLVTYRPEEVPQRDCPEVLKKAGKAGSGETASASTVVPTNVLPAGLDEQIKADSERLKALDVEIARQNERAQCELYPGTFSAEQISDLKCSGLAGNGRAHQAALEELTRLRGEKAEIQERQRQIAETNKAAADRINNANAAEAEERKKILAELRNSPAAIQADSDRTAAKDKLEKIRADGPYEAYGLSERFDATEEIVSPWIRWGLRMFFVLADMAPVLMKLAMGPSQLDIENSLRRQGVLHPELIRALDQERELAHAVRNRTWNGRGRNRRGNSNDSRDDSEGFIYGDARPPPNGNNFGRGRYDREEDPVGDGPTGPFQGDPF